MYWVRGFGGLLVLIGFLVMLYNLFKTAQSAEKNSAPLVYKAYALAKDHKKESGHRHLEGLPAIFTILAVIAVLVGSAIEILPSLMAKNWIEKDARVKPYTPLELAGRDIYISEGCYVCHSQMIREMGHEVLRYGPASEASESIYDHPFQWGSRRIGPDLARVGGKYNHTWHYRHMLQPREVVPSSLMPEYSWLFKKKTDFAILTKKVNVMRSLGVPYTEAEAQSAGADALVQATQIVAEMQSDGIEESMKNKQIIALIAYLQRLGTDLLQPLDETSESEQ
jgi:cytochrome c oxidase cbb3-type subunit I/II